MSDSCTAPAACHSPPRYGADACGTWGIPAVPAPKTWIQDLHSRRQSSAMPIPCGYRCLRNVGIDPQSGCERNGNCCNGAYGQPDHHHAAVPGAPMHQRPAGHLHAQKPANLRPDSDTAARCCDPAEESNWPACLAHREKRAAAPPDPQTRWRPAGLACAAAFPAQIPAPAPRCTGYQHKVQHPCSLALKKPAGSTMHCVECPGCYRASQYPHRTSRKSPEHGHPSLAALPRP